jgi:hypothetical protein
LGENERGLGDKEMGRWEDWEMGDGRFPTTKTKSLKQSRLTTKI